MKKNIGIKFEGIIQFIDTCKKVGWDMDDIVDELLAFCEKKVNQLDPTLFVGAQHYLEHDNTIALIDGQIEQEVKGSYHLTLECPEIFTCPICLVDIHHSCNPPTAQGRVFSSRDI